MSLKTMAEGLRPIFLEEFSQESVVPCRLFLSASSMDTPATVRNAVAESPEEAWDKALDRLYQALGENEISANILRADWVTESKSMTWESFNNQISTVSRNKFRQGLALDANYSIAFTEQELNANRMLYNPGNDDPETWTCIFRKDRSDEYCQLRFHQNCPEPTPSSLIETFHTNGVFVQDGDVPRSITAKGLQMGYRKLPKLTSSLIIQIVQKGSMYLARQTLKSGKFIYGYYPCSGNPYLYYSIIRHFGTIYSMLEAYESFETMGNATLGKALTRAIEYGIHNNCKMRTLPNGKEAAYVHEYGEICIGGNGLALLALTKYTTVMRSKKYLSLMRALAQGILSMQQENGAFIHSLDADDFSIKERFIISFYDGEAALGLLRLYAITQDDELLKSVEQLFAHFIATDYHKYHDHWVAYAVNDLTMRVPKREYFAFGIRNFKALPYIDFADNFAPAQLEMIMATESMLHRMSGIPEMTDLFKVESFDIDKLEKAMERRVILTINCFVWPETAMYFYSPEKAVYGFHDRVSAFRIRIDDIQHSISGLLAYSAYLERRN